ncbi:MAG: hypothetical protein EXR77_09400 [Myxococcales bacterium]|nr:hypothetical protein [Myxococcales bacterium]
MIAGCSESSGPVAADVQIGDSSGDSSGSPTDGSSADAADAAPAPLPVLSLKFCTGPTQLLYDPAGPGQVSTFPDDFHTKVDSATASGVHVAFDLQAPWLKNGPKILSRAIGDLNELDGFGTTAAVTLRFSAPISGNGVALPSGPTTVLAQGIVFADLGTELAPLATPERVPFEVQLTDENKTALLWPMRPLRPKHRHALIWTQAQLAVDGQCVAPSPVLQQVLQNQATDPRLNRMSYRAASALQALKIAPDQVSALALFTTQSTVEKSVLIAKDIAGRKFSWIGPATCQDGPLFRKCDRKFGAFDYRDGRLVADGKPQKPWTLTLSLWLPKGATTAAPVVIFGHGLGSGRSQGVALAELAAPQGLATLGIDAPAHGDHPTSDPVATGTLPTVIRFFGLDLGTLSVDGLKLRDHWRQASYDKLQLVQMLLADADIDGDGKPDIDMQKLMYLGVSLGGIMGPELLALSPHIKAAVLSVPGARVASIISDSTEFGPLIQLMKPENVSEGDVIRFFPMLQTLLDAGDSAAYAPHVLTDRLAGTGAPPHLLMQMAINDEIVPNVANRALARALGVAHAPPFFQEVGLVPKLNALPAKANLPGGQTAVLFQFDRATKVKGKPPEPSSHSSVPKSLEAMAQDLHFLTSWLSTGVAEAIDPYALLGTAALKLTP